MENLYGKVWEKYVIIRPPWSIGCVLKCALKHWIAAVGESFQRKGEAILKDIQMTINTIPTGGRKLEDVTHFLNKCSDLIQTLNDEKHLKLKEATKLNIDVCKKRHYIPIISQNGIFNFIFLLLGS